jgi:uncharacterized protein YukE
MNKIIEADILIALFKATIEQKTMLKGTLSHKFKQLFNQWERQGNILMAEFEGKDAIIDEHLEQIADVLHDTVDEIRKKITPVD